MQHLSLRVGKHPVPNGEIARLAVNRKRQPDWPGLRDGGQAGAVNRGNTMRGEARLMGLKLILKKTRTANLTVW
jgi:hypothetical protein